MLGLLPNVNAQQLDTKQSTSEKNVPEKSWLDSMLETFGASDELSTHEGIDWGVLPGPFVNPLQGVGLGVAAIGLYSPESRQAGTQISTLGIKSYVSSSGSYGLGIENRTYLGDDYLRLELDSWISHSPSKYWGIGRVAAENDANETEVKAKVFDLAPRISYRILPNTYTTLGLHYTSHSNMSADTSLLAPKQLENAQNTGITLGLAYDSRDFALNAYKGMLLELKYNDYSSALGSDYSFEQFTANYRQYYQIKPELILAWEIYGQASSGDVPWFALSEIGTDGRMRGYYQGQYRDKYQLNGQIELRQHLAGRHGLVYWMGAGNVASNRTELFHNNWLPTYGIGYRLAFKPRVNIRFDFGLGKKSSGFYFQINEAF